MLDTDLTAYKNMVKSMSTISKCKKKQVGALIVKDKRIISSGVNGTISGTDNICEEEVYTCNTCKKEILRSEFQHKGDKIEYICDCNTTHSISYIFLEYTNNKPFKLKTRDDVLHAEENAILYAANNGISIKDSIMFITLSPCIRCARMIAQVGIKKVYYIEQYRDDAGLKLLNKLGIETILL